MLRLWQDLTSPELARCDPARTVAILPIAATEQHGPHLPLGTDCHIAEGLAGELAKTLDPDVEALLLPTISVGASLEHMSFAGTLSLSAAQMTQTIVAMGEGVAASGLRKLILISSHGGNTPSAGAAVLELRARHGLLAVTTSWRRFGLPAELADDSERAVGIHGGFVETALMLHFKPDLVRHLSLENFPSRQSGLTERFRHLRAYGDVGYGWLAEDLNAEGVVGNAAAASAEAGAAIARHQARGMAELVREVAVAGMRECLAEQ
ncbi:creatininase family protein [Afifella sp. YEN Y35]|uniref:creatininase family protein n=1 Tax=Afifella sp. YEN Y35 TaxID=3388337 RepID=UPI0039E11B48